MGRSVVGIGEVYKNINQGWEGTITEVAQVGGENIITIKDNLSGEDQFVKESSFKKYFELINIIE